MAERQRVGDLEIYQDLAFEERAAWWQRAGWLVLTLVLLAGLLGLFGDGPLSRAGAGAPDGPLRVEYDRFGRLLGETELRVQLGAGTARDGTVRLWLERDYLDRMRPRRIAPEPEGVEAGPDRLIYTFRVADAGAPAQIIFTLEPAALGAGGAHLGLVDGPTVRLDQLIYP